MIATQPGTPDSGPLINPKQYQDMMDALGDDDFFVFVTEFFESCDDAFSKRLADLSNAGVAEPFFELCHEIKGAAGLLGFSGIADCAAAWEAAAKDGHVPGSGEVLERFNLLVGQSKDFVSQQR